MTAKLLFYTYSQNNSGGSFDVDLKTGIAETVIIQAASVEEANAKAENIGLYWNGCDSGIDCECCGDRWSQPWDDGTPTPEIYGQPVNQENVNKTFCTGLRSAVAVHYYDGRIKIWKNNKDAKLLKNA
jgi:hypothetical protein